MKVNKTAMAMVVGSLAAGLMNEARAAIALDRTRAIFPGSEGRVRQGGVNSDPAFRSGNMSVKR